MVFIFAVIADVIGDLEAVGLADGVAELRLCLLAGGDLGIHGGALAAHTRGAADRKSVV